MAPPVGNMPPPADSRQLERVMAKPEDNPQLEQRVAALEEHAGATDAVLAEHEQAIADLNARVAVLEQAASTTPPIEIGPPGGIIDNTLPTPEPPDPPDPELGEGLAVVIRAA